MQSYAQLRTKTVQKYKQVDTHVLDRRYKVQVQEVQVMKSKEQLQIEVLIDMFKELIKDRKEKCQPLTKLDIEQENELEKLFEEFGKLKMERQKKQVFEEFAKLRMEQQQKQLE